MKQTLYLMRRAVAGELGLDECAPEVRRVAWALYSALPHVSDVTAHGNGRVAIYVKRHSAIQVDPLKTYLIVSEPRDE